MVSDSDTDAGGPPIPVLPDEKSIDDFLTLKQEMKVPLMYATTQEASVPGLASLTNAHCEASGVDSLFPTVSLLSSQ